MNRISSSEPPGIACASEVKAVIFDWAGTTVDFGSLAPVRTLQKVFDQAQCPVTESEARESMGLPKLDHIRSLLAEPDVAARWAMAHGDVPHAEDAERLYQEFVPLQFSCLAEYSGLIPGVAEMAERLRQRGIRIGSSTGYTRAMLDLLVEQSRRSGYAPDVNFSPEDVGGGRPHPYMVFEAAVQLRVYPLGAIVKVGDTPADIAEGLNAGAWAVGVAATGNMVGLSQTDFGALSQTERQERIAAGREALAAAGAHYVIDSVADLEPVIAAINERLAMAAAGAAQ
jgi:phosphonoacetaldehyde hydrolase